MERLEKIKLEEENINKVNKLLIFRKFNTLQEQQKYEFEILIPAIIECFNYYKFNFLINPNIFITFFTDLFHRIINCYNSNNEEWLFIKEQFDNKTIIKDYHYISEFIDTLSKYMPDYRYSIDIPRIIDELKYADKLVTHRDKFYYEWNLSIKKIELEFVNKHYISLIQLYPEQLDYIHVLFLKDVSYKVKRLPQNDTINNIAKIILEYATKYIHTDYDNDKFQIAFNDLLKLRDYNGAKKLALSEEEYIQKIREMELSLDSSKSSKN